MGEIQVLKIVDTSKKYKDKNGKEHTSVNYYLMFNDTRVPIRPNFSKGYTQLDMICKTIINGKSE